MYIAFPLPDGSYFKLVDLPWAMVEEIEKKHATSWVIVIDTPQMNGGVLADLARCVAIVNDLDAPILDTVNDLDAISKSLVVVDENGRRLAVEDAEEAPLAWSAS